MAVFELDEGRARLAQPMLPTESNFAADGAALVGDHLTGLLGENLFPVRPRQDGTGPHLLALDADGRPVVVEVVRVLDAETIIDALRHAGAAARLSRSDLARAYYRGIAEFGPDLAAFSEQVPVARQRSTDGGARLLLVCAEVDESVMDVVAYLRSPGRVDVLQMGVLRGADGRRFVDVSPVDLPLPDRRSVEPTPLRVVRAVDAYAEAMAHLTPRRTGTAQPPAASGGAEAPAVPSQAAPASGRVTLASSSMPIVASPRSGRLSIADPGVARPAATAATPPAAAAPATPLPAAPAAPLSAATLPAEASAQPAAVVPARLAAPFPVPVAAAGLVSEPRAAAVPSAPTAPSTPTVPSAPAMTTAPASPAASAAAVAPAPQTRPAALAPQRSRHSTAGGPLADLALLMGGGVDLVWIRLRRGQRFTARLQSDGSIVLPDGQVHADPDAAATAAAASEAPLDGWHAWRLGETGPTLAEALAR